MREIHCKKNLSQTLLNRKRGVMDSETLEKIIKKNNESEIVEYKTNFDDGNKIGEYISALGNSALIDSNLCAYMIWGVKDSSKEIIGTKFDPYVSKARFDPKNGKKPNNNIPLITFLENHLDPAINLNWYEVSISNKRMVCLTIDVEKVMQPIKFRNESYIRSGTSVKKLSMFPEKERRLWRSFESCKFELEFAKTNLHFNEIEKFLDIEYYQKHLKKENITESELINSLIKDNIIVSLDKQNFFNITNLGAYTFAKNIEDFPQLAKRTLRITKYKGNKKIDNAIFDRKGNVGIIVAFDNIIKNIMRFIPSVENYKNGIRVDEPQFPLIVVRELLANALAHQDFSIQGMRPMVEIYDNRIVIENPGVPLIDNLRFLDHPPISRNTELANLLEKFKVVELRGTGIDKVVDSLQTAGLPSLEISIKESNATQIILRSKKEFDELTPTEVNEKIYWSACLSYVNDERISNSSIRNIFSLNKNQNSKISRAISRAVEANLIKPYDKNAGRKNVTYIPFWGKSVQSEIELADKQKNN